MVPEIPGAAAVVAWFGHWPSFHHAEVLSVVINRGGLSMIRIHAWNLSARVDRKGQFTREREAIIVFEFAGIKNLRLQDDNEERQNLVHEGSIERTEQGYRFRFAPSRGLAGELTAEQIAVHLETGR
jgi:Immunity protein 50